MGFPDEGAAAKGRDEGFDDGILKVQLVFRGGFYEDGLGDGGWR